MMHLRLDRERAGDADALALAAGELVRVALGGVARQMHEIEQLARRAPAISARRHDACTRERLGQAVAARVMRGLSEP